MSREFDYVQHIPMITYNTAGINGTFASLNGTGFPTDIKLLVVYNGGTNAVTISFNGVDDGHYFPPLSTFTFDIQTNHACNSAYSSGTKVARKGQIIFGKGTAGTGNLYIMGYY
jgi:hypothetical protein